MFWRLFVKDSPLLDSALEGIVFKEGKGRFYGRFCKKKRLLAYDEVAKCLRYYTPQRALKEALEEMSEKIACLKLQFLGEETKKWIGILSRELDTLKIRDRIHLNNGNIAEATFSKTLRPNSAILNSLRIGEHREHEECCFLFDEEHQHKIIALESLCSLQAMKIYELSHSVERFQRKCDDLETPPSEEVRKLQHNYNKLRVHYEQERLEVIELKAKLEEEEINKLKEHDKQLVRKVEKHQHIDLVSPVKMLQIERTESPKPISNQKKNIQQSPSFVNLPNSDKSRMEEIKKLQEELDNTRALLAQAKASAYDNPFQPVNFNTPSTSPLYFDTRSIVTTTTTTTTSTTGTTTPNRSPNIPTRTPSNLSNSSKLQSIPESTAIKVATSSYRTFSPALTNPYIDTHTSNFTVREPSPKQQQHSNPPSPQNQRSQQSVLSTQIISPQPHYPPQPLVLDPNLIHPASPSQESTFSESSDSISSEFSSPISSTNSAKSNSRSNLRNSNPTQTIGDFNVVSVVSTKSTATINSVKTVNTNDFNVIGEAPIRNKPSRSYSESGGPPPFKSISRPNGKLTTSDNGESTAISPRTRTASNPPPFNPNFASIKSRFDIEDLLTSHPDDNGWTVQALAKLNEAVAEISALSTQLQHERALVKSLTAEKDHMLDTMEEKARTQKFRYEMEELMETTQGKLDATRDALESETQRRKVAEAKLSQLAQARAALQQSILDDELPPKTEILQPLLTSYSH